ncbi:aminopeptidase P family protein [Acaryochloris marina]|uniref:Xaa-Pro aminopeptidase n=1 Tax=Acaryochloris marina (strain MBIC 11017) TaxID=329726 RepID=B0CBJ8_ACAM1|nr:aminopeptidase P family protein [Acaryochloris marina]ABW29116.1 xaa-pro dipeptidase [Acaryochloris marina MBIC11017]BDM78064.1 Xaa-Pro aminopeptidase [Acaryochloris marina MBIC10699]
MLTPTDQSCLHQRRHQLGQQFEGQALLWSGVAPSRNFAANQFPFRASSHFLYLAGLPLQNAVIGLEAGQLTLFWDEPHPDTALWHGPSLSRAEIADQIGAETHLPLSAVSSWASHAATLPVPSSATHQQQIEWLGRPVPPIQGSQDQESNRDHHLANALIQLRLQQDEFALAQLRQAAEITVAAHLRGMRSTLNHTSEAAIRAEIESVMMAHQCPTAYASIVTVHGEVLHNDAYPHALAPGDLLLVDAGAETPLGWAADVTRTWPVSGQFSATQRDLYDLVLAAHDACIAAIQPGVEFRDLHLLAAQTIASGLVDIGILKGQPEALVERDAHALFFPHGIGHLLGLDVHDMEDLGDLAGYAPGRQRCDRRGLRYLRLDRPLRPQMLVTIEPGFYQIPALLQNPDLRQQYGDCVNWDRLAQFEDVRGIRIEDDVLVTPEGCQVLTSALPTQAPEVEAYVQGSTA